MPDLFNGNPVSEKDMNSPPGVDRRALLTEWKKHHGPETVDPILEKVISHINATYNPKFSAAAGYCFGAKYCIRLLGLPHTLQSAAIFHPAMLEQHELDAIVGKRQTLFVSAPDNDSSYTKEVRERTEARLKELADTEGFRYKATLLHGVGHGFAVRGDISDPWIKYSKEQTFRDAVEWFNGSERLLSA